MPDPIEIEDVEGTWPSKRLHGMFSFVDAVGFAVSQRRSGRLAWCVDLWSAKDVRQYAREVHRQS